MAPKRFSDATRTYPHGEDYMATAGGDTDMKQKSHARPPAFSAGPALGNSPSSPPGENKDFNQVGNFKGSTDSFRAVEAPRNGGPPSDQLENSAALAGLPAELNQSPQGTNFLKLVRDAESQASRYIAQINRRAWSQSLRAFNNQHYLGSKYTQADWRNRSNIFRPKTRSAVRKDMAAVAASLFGSIDAVSCLAGNEGDARQRAAADLMQELVNYRTDRSSGKAALPWFAVAMGARQDALITGICVSKQSWKLELREEKKNQKYRSIGDDDAVSEVSGAKSWVIDVDRPDSQLIPPENIVIDPAADWTDPIQSAAYVIIKWPMAVQEIEQKQRSPLNPWNQVRTATLLGNTDSGTTDTSAIRRARDLGIDRYDETQTGRKFQIVWIYEVFMRVDGEDYTFLSCGDRAFLTNPKPTREVYPEQFGERPLAMGYGHLESHRIFPMSPVESWQQYQVELNDLANLVLDATKQNVMPISKIRRGKQVDLDQVRRRSSGSAIMVQEPDDVTWETPPQFPAAQVAGVTRELELELDDLAGQFNGQTAENNNALSRTLGGLKLVSGSANAVQEFDIRVWIETWAQVVIAQLVRLEQYYEHDDVILGICGDRANLVQKHGVSSVTDELLEEEITVRVSVGLGAGDPQQRLMKFGQALQMAMPIAQASPEFQRGELEVDTMAVFQEIFGGAGYRDGGARFIREGKAKPQDPKIPLEMDKLKSEIEKNKKTGNAAMLTALSAAAKVALGQRETESAAAENIARLALDARDMGVRHAEIHHKTLLAAADHGSRHGMAVRQQGHQETLPAPGSMDGAFGGDDGSKAAPAASGPPPAAPAGQPPAAQSGAPPPSEPSAAAPPADQGASPPAGPGAPPPAGPQGPAPQPPPRPSMMSILAGAEPAPPPNEPPSPQQMEVDQLRAQNDEIRGRIS